MTFQILAALQKELPETGSEVIDKTGLVAKELAMAVEFREAIVSRSAPKPCIARESSPAHPADFNLSICSNSCEFLVGESYSFAAEGAGCQAKVSRLSTCFSMRLKPL